ncbi:hypothetical protein Lal_00005912 [Lupinus albus]|nr:hypothetical protein Lal_00005912 [Lupinus albus]
MAALFVKKNVLPLMLVTVYLTLQMMVGVETVDIGIAKDTSVTMFNNISQQPLTIHCQEKGYDDGFHNVSPGESYCINEHFTPLTFLFKKEIKGVPIMGVSGI